MLVERAAPSHISHPIPTALKCHVVWCDQRGLAQAAIHVGQFDQYRRFHQISWPASFRYWYQWRPNWYLRYPRQSHGSQIANCFKIYRSGRFLGWPSIPFGVLTSLQLLVQRPGEGLGSRQTSVQTYIGVEYVKFDSTLICCSDIKCCIISAL